MMMKPIQNDKKEDTKERDNLFIIVTFYQFFTVPLSKKNNLFLKNTVQVGTNIPLGNYYIKKGSIPQT
jgi:hypothetical protein